MIILGHKLIPFTPLYQVSKIEDIKKTAPNSPVLFDFSDEKMLKYCKEQDVPFALHVKSITESCIANALGALFIIVDYDLAQSIQPIAVEYLFDTKVLVLMEDEEQIELIAKSSIDGIIFQNAIKKKL